MLKHALVAFTLLASLAEVSNAMQFLPLEDGKFVYMNVESVCGTYDLTTKFPVEGKQVVERTLAVTFTSGLRYPYSMEWMGEDRRYTVLYVMDKLRYVSPEGKLCYEEKTESPEDQLWSIIYDALSSDKLSGTTFDQAVKGISVNSVQYSITATIPTALGGSGTSASYQLIMNMNSDYRFSFSNVKNYPISMTLGSATTQCEFTFTYTSLNNFVVDFDIPLCIPAPTTKELAQDKESEVKNPNPMPEFPDEFSTDIQVIMPSKKTIFKMHHAYSQPEEFAHSTLQGVQPDEVGRAVEYEWYIRGKSQASYFITQKAVPPGLEMVEPKLREYFYPNVATCTKVFIGYTPLANSGAELFLVDPDKTPSYLGRETVRGVPCKVWAVLSHGSLRTWYWSDEQYTKNTSQLLRMTVRGVGLSPFFPHHPFYAQGEAFPIQDRPLVCAFMTPMMNYNVGCDDSRGSEAFEYTYEITSFVPYIPMRDTTFPELCINVDASLSVPSSACRFSGIPAALVAILLIIIAIVFLFLGCCCVWCRYSVMVRRLEEELLYVTAELRRDAEAEGAPVQDGAVEQPRPTGWRKIFASYP